MFIDFLYINQNIRNIKRTLEIDKKNHVCRFIETRRLKKKKKKKRMATKTVKSTKNKNARDESVQKTWI